MQTQHTGYLAPLELEEQLESELKDIKARYGRLFIAEGSPQKVYFAQNIWLDPQVISFTSISEAANRLKELQRLWAFYPYKEVRRGELISSHLPYFSPKPLDFGTIPPSKPLGSWTLLDANTLLASPNCSSSFAHGEVHFQESSLPPSRAYLKLWEVFTRIGQKPGPGDRCLDLGACPGSWTWVLQSLGASVIAVDRAAIDPDIAKLPKVTFLKRDGFSLKPGDLPPLDWICSDMICYPERLLNWLKLWIEALPRASFICTLKFQGKRDYEIVREFEQIENSQVVHLFHNKHELTWFRLGKTL